MKQSIIKRPPGRPRTLRHGGYSYVTTGLLPKDKRYVELYLDMIRESYVQYLGSDEKDLSPGQLILLDKLITLEGLTRCMEIEAAERGVMKLPQRHTTYLNHIIKICLSLGIEKREEKGKVLTPAELAKVVDLEVAEKKKQEKKE